MRTAQDFTRTGAGPVIPLMTAGLAAFAQHAPAMRVDVELVTVPYSVTDQNGALVRDLGADDFVLSDNEAPQQIKQLWRDLDQPLTVGLIVDVSGSQMGMVGKHKRTMSEFLTRVLGEQDRAFLVTVGPDVRLVTDVTGSVDELRGGVESIERYTDARLS